MLYTLGQYFDLSRAVRIFSFACFGTADEGAPSGFVGFVGLVGRLEFHGHVLVALATALGVFVALQPTLHVKGWGSRSTFPRGVYFFCVGERQRWLRFRLKYPEVSG